MARIRIGTSGWDYDDWEGTFWPKDLAKAHRLEHITRRFESVENNGTFYSLQKPGTYRKWYDSAPRGFRYALKGPGFITRTKKLHEPRAPTANFFASGLMALKEKLGPILWQFPHAFGFDAQRLADFLDLLPHDTEAAARLAQEHDDNLKHEPMTTVDRAHHIRHVFEFRHESWFRAETVRLLRRRGAALAFSDSPGAWPYTEEVTAGFVYLRLHGSRDLYESRYTDKELDRWAGRIRAWHEGEQPEDARTITDRPPPGRKHRDVYVYFDNTARGHAPANALALGERLKQG